MAAVKRMTRGAVVVGAKEEGVMVVEGTDGAFYRLDIDPGNALIPVLIAKPTKKDPTP